MEVEGKEEGKEGGREEGREGGSLSASSLAQFCFYLCLVNLDPVVGVCVGGAVVFAFPTLSPTSI